MGYWKKQSIESSERRRLTNQLRKSRRSANLPFELSLESSSSSEIDKYQRAQDKVELNKFNQDVEEWSEKSKQELRRSIKSLVKRDVSLSDSLKANIYYDNKYAKEANRVGFSFVREGVYIHRGAGRGQGGVIGGRWIDRHGTMKSRSADSAGLQGTGNRKPILWFDPVIEGRLPQLADIVADYSATMQINTANLFIDK
ncbi:MAG: hypothetical protein PHR52_10990 [Fermentimonas sp.]|nr:hypothetical protein [Fermentimonas sp.]